MPYPKDFLETRAITKKNSYAVIPKESRVINTIPGYEGFATTILCSAKIGAWGNYYFSKVQPGAKTTAPIFKGDEELFVYVLKGSGTLQVTVADKIYQLAEAGYVYVPPGVDFAMHNASEQVLDLFFYKQKYKRLDGYSSEVCVGNANDIEERIYDDMENVFIKDFLPTHLGFDMNIHILSFEPGGCHPFVETHVQEHGAYILSGQGFYRLAEDWIQVKQDDFLWFAPYTAQGSYGTGRTRFTYIYTKDCNRDEALV